MGSDLASPDELPELDLRTLRMVAAIDRAGSITGAARLMGYSQPAISQHLRRVEKRLGVLLVHRDGRSARLSEAGRVLLDIAPAVDQGLRFAASQIREIRAVGTGRLTGAAKSEGVRLGTLC